MARSPICFAALWGGVYALWGAAVLLLFLHSPGLQHHPPSNLARMVYGTADRPFVYRTLIPTIVRVITATVPDRARAVAGDYARNDPLARVFRFCDRIPAEMATEFIVAVALMYAALLGFLYVLRALFAAVYEAPPGTANWVPLLALVLLPPFFRYTSFLYDFPALLFFSLGLLLLVQRRWTAFLLLFVVSCVNKETTILLTMVFGVYFWGARDLPRRQYWLLGASQVLIFAAIKGTVNYIFRYNQGSMVEFHLRENLALFEPYSVTTAAGCLTLALFVGCRWSEQPWFLRVASLVLIPLVVLTLFLGQFDELRDYYEAFPAFALLIFHGLARLMGVEVKARPGAETASAARFASAVT